MIFYMKDNFKKLDQFQLEETVDVLEYGVDLKEKIKDGVVLSVYLRDEYNNFDTAGNHSPYSLKFNIDGKDVGYIKIPTPQEYYNNIRVFKNDSRYTNQKDNKWVGISIAYCKFHYQAICDFIDFKSRQFDEDRTIQNRILEFIQSNTLRLKKPDEKKFLKAMSNIKYTDQYYSSGDIRSDFIFIKTIVKRRESLNHPNNLPINPSNKYLKMYIDDQIDLNTALEYMNL